MKKEFRPRRSPLTRTKHYLSFDERLWKRLQVVADKHYRGNRSRALEGLRSPLVRRSQVFAAFKDVIGLSTSVFGKCAGV